jgi:hypothetical protein
MKETSLIKIKIMYEDRRHLGYKTPVLTSQETLLLRYRAQPVNAM